MEMFDERLKDIQCRALSDSVAHIRERAILNLAELSKEFGDEWMKASILPSVQEAAKGTGPASYLGRIRNSISITSFNTFVASSRISYSCEPRISSLVTLIALTSS
jgi:hypothetical protein